MVLRKGIYSTRGTVVESNSLKYSKCNDYSPLDYKAAQQSIAPQSSITPTLFGGIFDQVEF